MKLFEKLTIAALGVLLAGSAAGITTTTILDNKRIDDLQSQINDLNTRADELQEQIDNLKEQYNALKAQEEADIARVTADYQAKIDALQEEINSLYAELEALETEYTEKLDELQTELARVEREYKQADASDKATLESKIAGINNTIYELNSKYQGEVARINNTIASLNNSITALQKALNDAIQAIKDEYDSKLEDIIDRLEALEGKDKTTYPTAWIASNYFNGTTYDNLKQYRQVAKNVYELSYNITETISREYHLTILTKKDGVNWGSGWKMQNYNDGKDYFNIYLDYNLSWTEYVDLNTMQFLNPTKLTINTTSAYTYWWSDAKPESEEEAMTKAYTEANLYSQFTLGVADGYDTSKLICTIDGTQRFYNEITGETMTKQVWNNLTVNRFDINTYLGQ